MILMNNYQNEPAILKEAMVKACKKVIGSGFYILGKEVQSFEKKWSDTCKVKYSIGVANGLDAVEISLRALKLGKGDEVITTSMTAFATVLAIIHSGATPVLADIDPDTGLLDWKSVSRCLSPKTRAILLVHLYGQIRNIKFWQKFCKEKRLFLVEDCAQSHLAKVNNKMAGSFGDLGAFSFYPTKNLGGIGDGGIISTNNIKLAEKASLLRNYGQSNRYEHSVLGLNSRLDELQAAILIERLKWLREFTKTRQYNAQFYHQNIKNSRVRLLSLPKNKESHVYHLFVILCEKRDLLADYLNKEGIQTLIHYPIPIHKQKPCISVKRDPKGLKNSENHAMSCLSIPCNPQLNHDDLKKIVQAINKYQG